MSNLVDKIDEYTEELAKDVKIDESTMKNCTMELPGLKSKWARRLMLSKNDLNKLKRLKKIKAKEIFEKYKTEQIINLSDVALNKLVYKSDIIIKIDNAMQDTEILIELFERCEQICRDTSFNIKHLIDIIQLETT